MNFRKPLLLACAVLCLAGFTASTFNLTTINAQSKRSAGVKENFRAAIVPLVTATLSDSFPDVDTNGRAAAGEEVTYTATITNSGSTDATGVTFAAPVDSNAALVPGSVQVQPDLASYAVRCTFDTAPALGGGSLCTLTSSAYGATGTDNYIILGGQGNRFNFGATNPAYNSGTGIFSFDATIQSLLQQRMGTIDGVTADAAGVRLFVNSLNVTSGTGSVTAFNQTGNQTYTAPNQPYFQFPETGLIFGEITQPKVFEFSVPNTVNTFTVDFLVSTKVAARFVINEVYANPGGTISDANGEWFEMVNTGLFPVYLEGFKIGDSAASGDRPLHTISNLNPVSLPGDYFVFGNTTNLVNNGNVTVDYAYANAIAYGNNGPDSTRVVSPVSDAVVYDRVDYPTASVNAGVNGISRELEGLALDNSNMEDDTNWQFGTFNYGPGGQGTPGSINTGVAPLANKGLTASVVSVPEGGETVLENLGTISPGGSAVVTYRVTVADPIPMGTTQLSAQGSVSGTNFGDIVTDDPGTGTGSDATVTPIGLAPSAGEVSIGGRVVTSSGNGIANATVHLADRDGNRGSAVTNPFGYYQFNDVAAGETYFIGARHRSYHFETRIVTVGDDITDLDFVAID